MRLIIVFICKFAIILNSVLAFNEGKIITNGDRYRFTYAILALKTEQDTEFQSEKQFEYKCVATAISQNHLITAGHCLSEYWKVNPKESLNIYYVYHAEVRMNFKHIEGAIPFDARDVEFHPNFTNVDCPPFDVAIITLPTSIFLRNNIPLCSRLDKELQAVSLIKARGNRHQPHLMNSGIFKIENPDKCVSPNFSIQYEEAQLCTSSVSFSEKGDSGSPLITTSEQCLVGILSCGSREFTIFSNLLIHADWIQNVAHNGNEKFAPSKLLIVYLIFIFSLVRL